MDRSFDLPDSTDWLNSSLPALAPLESALRCQICKDFFNNPVITSCSHTFCSLCIRRCLSAEGKCPACRSSDQEVKLRRNWAVQEIVESFQNARLSVLALAQIATVTEEDNETSHPAAKRRRLNEPEEPVSASQPEMRRTRSQGKQVEQQASHALPDVVDDGKDEDYVPDDGLVRCPMCSRRMKEEAVFNHLDTCKGPTEDRTMQLRTSNIRTPQPPFLSPRNQSPTKPLERLPTLNYSLFKENMLRKKLKELGIPEWGSRALLQRRHTEWMNLWNANCDAKAPKTKEELRRDLEIWERTQGGTAPQSGASIGPNAVMAKNFDAAAWSTSHDDDFKRLIENARRKNQMNKDQTPVLTDAKSGPDNLQGDTTTSSNVDEETHGPLIHQPSSADLLRGVGESQGSLQNLIEPYPPSTLNGDLIIHADGDNKRHPAT